MSKIALVGLGLVGRAWAISFARAGHDVALWDDKPDAADEALRFADEVLPDLAANQLLRDSPAAVRARMRRAATLEEQAVVPMESPFEMANTQQAVVATLSGIAGYRAMFAEAFGSDGVDIERVTMAIACFERTVLSGNSPYDRYKRGDVTALTAEQVRGMAVFFDKASCDRCHQGLNFTSNAYANEGIGADKPEPDAGRYAVTHDARDWGAFKIPTLRDVEQTAPYMHDGSLLRLEDVVEFYDKGGIANRNLDANIRPLHLSDRQKADLVAFLKGLSGEGWQSVRAPERFPK